MDKTFLTVGAALVAVTTMTVRSAGQSVEAADSASESSWRTYAEATSFRQTPRYDETVAFCKRLAAASPWIHYETFGVSPRGREMPLVIASKEGRFDPAYAQAAGKRVLLVQNCIHAGECCGKDGSLMFLRDLAIHHKHPGLLDHTVLLVIPIFNVDGHERFGPYSRINQNGPEAMGWRVTSRNLNLNRDYTKADSVEMQAWLGLWNRWQPDVHIDNHTTDGGDWQYDVTLDWATDRRIAPALANWNRQFLDGKLLSLLRDDGHLPMIYFTMIDGADPSKGIRSDAFSPRFAQGYGAVRNRPSVLVEAHALKDYRTRVVATYDVLKRVLEIMRDDPTALGEAVRNADEQTARLAEVGAPVPLAAQDTDEGEPFTLKAVEHTVVKSDVSTRDWITYHPERPRDVASTWFHTSEPDKFVVPPRAYLIPPEWTDVIERLERHGVLFDRVEKETTMTVEQYRLSEPAFAPRPFEGRFRVSYKVQAERVRRTVPAGFARVPMRQPAARLAMHLLEPDAPDSLAAWGFFNAVFEQKEWASPRVLERMAREMMDKDPTLRERFEKRVAGDESFAQNPWARLTFFYEQTPYWDETIGVYPVVRVVDDAQGR